jgi:hypothetical protein
MNLEHKAITNTFIMLEIVFLEMMYPQIVRLSHSVFITLPIHVQVHLARTEEHVLLDIIVRLIACVPLALLVTNILFFGQFSILTLFEL